MADVETREPSYSYTYTQTRRNFKLFSGICSLNERTDDDTKDQRRLIAFHFFIILYLEKLKINL